MKGWAGVTKHNKLVSALTLMTNSSTLVWSLRVGRVPAWLEEAGRLFVLSMKWKAINEKFISLINTLAYYVATRFKAMDTKRRERERERKERWRVRENKDRKEWKDIKKIKDRKERNKRKRGRETIRERKKGRERKGEKERGINKVI